MKYIKQNNLYTFDFDLDERYNVGESYEDSLNGKYVKLSDEQISFKENNPSASIKEVFDMKLKEAYTQSLDAKKATLKRKIENYDDSDEVNRFFFNGVKMWFVLDRRVGLRVNAQDAIENGTEVTWYYDNLSLSLPAQYALDRLKELEAYALQCNNTKYQHLMEVDDLTEEEVDNYILSKDYPEILEFNTPI